LCEVKGKGKVHRLIPSRFPPVSLFDWADSQDELTEIAALEGLTNDRLHAEQGDIYLVAKDDWVGGPGSTPLMAAFTHPGNSRFSDGTFGVYYAGDTVETAIAETKYHRERFLKASKEQPCLIQMREYISNVQEKLVDLFPNEYANLFDSDPVNYSISQEFAREARQSKAYGLYYPSVRYHSGKCVAIFRPPALTIPIQGGHFDYIWDGSAINEVRRSHVLV
jgi:hypothetical protein